MADFFAGLGAAAPDLISMQANLEKQAILSQQAEREAIKFGFEKEQIERKQKQDKMLLPVDVVLSKFAHSPSMQQQYKAMIEKSGLVKNVAGIPSMEHADVQALAKTVGGDVELSKNLLQAGYQDQLQKYMALNQQFVSEMDPEKKKKLAPILEAAQKEIVGTVQMLNLAEFEKARIQSQSKGTDLTSKIFLENIKHQNRLSEQSARPQAMNSLEFATAASRVGTPQEQPGDKEKKAALDYNAKQAEKTAEARGKGYAEFRPINAIDTKNNTIIEGMSQAAMVEANKEEPGRYVLSTPSAYEKAMKQTALLSDIRMNIQATRESVNALKTDFNEKQRLKFFEAMRSANPKNALSNLVGGEFGKSLTTDQLQYLTDVNALIENSMAMRQVLGAGQGSEDLRDAIKATIPSPTSFSKEYSNMQLNKFDQILNRLESGVLKVKLRTDTGAPKEEKKPVGLDLNKFFK